MGMKQYRGKRRERDDRGVSSVRGGTPSQKWTPPTPQGTDPDAVPAGTAPGVARRAVQPDRSAGQRGINAKFTNTVYVTKTESEQVLPGNPLRSYLAIQNRGTNAIFLSFGSKATEDSFRLVAGGFYEPYIAPNTSLNIRGAAADDRIVIIEGFME